MLRIAIALYLVLATLTASGAERLDVCATYKSTRKAYKVEATIIRGSELNEKTRTFDYSPFSTYAVIFWADGQASIIEFDYYFGSVTVFGLDGKDQGGGKWEISTNTLCW